MAKFPEHVVERDLAGCKWVRWPVVARALESIGVTPRRRNKRFGRGRVGHFVLYRAEDVLAYMETKKAEQVERMLNRV